MIALISRYIFLIPSNYFETLDVYDILWGKITECGENMKNNPIPSLTPTAPPTSIQSSEKLPKKSSTLFLTLISPFPIPSLSF